MKMIANIFRLQVKKKLCKFFVFPVWGEYTGKQNKRDGAEKI